MNNASNLKTITLLLADRHAGGGDCRIQLRRRARAR